MKEDVEKYREKFTLGQKFVPISKRYFEDFKLGERFVSPAKLITATELDLFCMLTGHDMGIHVDYNLAKASGYSNKVVPALYALAQIVRFMHKIGIGEMTRLFLGLDKVKMLHPLLLDDPIYMEFEVKEKKEVEKWKDLGIITLSFSIKTLNGRSVCEGEGTWQIKRRPR